jgi:hypothetical protein
MRITLNAQILHNFITRSAHNLCLGFHGILGSDGTVKGIARAASESGESAPRQMTNIVSRIGDSVGLAAGCTLLGGADVYLIVLELADLRFVVVASSSHFVVDTTSNCSNINGNN